MEYTMHGKAFIAISEEESKYTYGAVRNYGGYSWGFVRDIQELPVGYYEFVGTSNQFKIQLCWGSDTEKQISVSMRDKGNPIDGFADLESAERGEEGHNSDELDCFNDADFFESEHAYECSRCRGGGCPSCDTSGYFTGFRIYD